VACQPQTTRDATALPSESPNEADERTPGGNVPAIHQLAGPENGDFTRRLSALPLEKGRVQAEETAVDKRLARTKAKTEPADSFSPNFVLAAATSKNDVVTVDTNWKRPLREKAEGEVVLETQKREAQVAPHQLPALLSNNATSRITYPSPKSGESVLPKGTRHETRTCQDPRKDPLSHLRGQVISGALVIATNKNLALHFPEGGELLPSSLPSQQPILFGQEVVESSVERPEDVGVTV